ncbi:uracil-DNA glycosylase [Aureicoccus marinus]|jgi:uracil-DNA glycosylase|uniref:Uracil-DNA glycosylase-like domain-containing protein n=1 Tax=Aureicoccus marinus TaxID=754435 RepID=A0A2S7T951_9FLAO|nr:uracil-DNA glycosylase [Aureicoccus marinus]PQJ16111.1 hypothetical protein BST99_10585 [Aureicoccus marinus]
MEKTDSFMRYLARCKAPENSRHLYAGRSRAVQVRKHNLRQYLCQFAKSSPEVLLVGEAPGYRGCGTTGIPFTSERLLEEHSFFKQGDYQFNSKGVPHSESSATIVWEVISSLNTLPLLWNSYPFHPHQVNDPMSNRAPNEEELALGKRVLVRLMKTYSPQGVIAIGKKAEKQLRAMNLDFEAVRHPSFGGKTDFQQGLIKLLGK